MMTEEQKMNEEPAKKPTETKSPLEMTSAEAMWAWVCSEKQRKAKEKAGGNDHDRNQERPSE